MFLKSKLAFKDFLALRAWQGGDCHWVHVSLVCQHSFLSDKSLSTEITKNHPGRFRIGCFFTSKGNERMNGWMSGFYASWHMMLDILVVAAGGYYIPLVATGGSSGTGGSSW